MSLAQELVSSNCLYTHRINDALRNHKVKKIAKYIRSSEDFDELKLNGPPVNEELGRRISDAIVQNWDIRTLEIDNSSVNSFAIRDLVAWIGSRNTLVNMTRLEDVRVYHYHDMSVLDCSALFPLLLTSTSLHYFAIYFHGDNGCSDDVMSALSSYLGTASLTQFGFDTRRLSEAAFIALCNGVALSTLRQINLGERTLQNFDLKTAAEFLARMIMESSLEEITIMDGVTKWSKRLIYALKLTAPVQNMDFAFTIWGGGFIAPHLSINRKWKPLIFSANTQLALWPQILEKSQASPETSHSSADIIFYVLRQKPDLVPAP